MDEKPQYPPFVRDGQRITPTWRTYQPGEQCYDIRENKLYECIEEDVRLEAATMEANEPDRGEPPGALGFDEPLLSENPRWVLKGDYSA